MTQYWAEAVLILIGASAVGTLAVLAIRPSGPREPSYEHQPLHFWVGQLDGTNASKARRAIRAIGKPAVPFLIQAARQGQWPQPGPLAALELLGPEAEPQLICALADPNPRTRLSVLRALARFGPNLSRPSDRIIPSLIERLRDSNPEIRLVALLVLDRMGPARVRAVPFLITALESDGFESDEQAAAIRQMVARVLGRIGFPAQAAIPTLTKMMTDPNACTDQQAAMALWQITHNRTLVVPELTRMLNDTDAATRALGVVALSRIGREADLGPDLLAQLEIKR